MSRKLSRLAPLVFTVAVFGCSLLVWAALPLRQGLRQRDPPRTDSRAREPVGRSVPSDAEFAIRDVYARLMRYHFAAVQIHQEEAGVTADPEAYLVATVGDITTSAWPTGNATPGPGTQADGLALNRVALCHDHDPCHLYYDVWWAGKGPRMRLEPPAGATPSAYTTYQVRLELQNRTLTYRAAAFHYPPANGNHTTTRIVDPAIRELDLLTDERLPLPAAPWIGYVNGPRYAAVVAGLIEANRGGVAPRNAPIGWLPGDDVDAVTVGTMPRPQIAGFGPPQGATVCCNVADATTLIKQYKQHSTIGWVPACDDFISSWSSSHFTFAQMNHSEDNGYSVAIIKPMMATKLDLMWDCMGFDFLITCGYRSPEKNALLQGASATSRHLFGDAVDVRTASDWGYTWWLNLHAAADAAGAAHIEAWDYSPPSSHSHLHADWHS